MGLKPVNGIETVVIQRGLYSEESGPCLADVSAPRIMHSDALGEMNALLYGLASRYACPGVLEQEMSAAQWQEYWNTHGGETPVKRVISEFEKTFQTPHLIAFRMHFLVDEAQPMPLNIYEGVVISLGPSPRRLGTWELLDAQKREALNAMLHAEVMKHIPLRRDEDYQAAAELDKNWIDAQGNCRGCTLVLTEQGLEAYFFGGNPLISLAARLPFSVPIGREFIAYAPIQMVYK